MKVFPVLQTAKSAPSFSNDWGMPRSGGRTHKGTDIFADKGTPLLAVDDGQVKFGADPLGGNIASLRATDGTRYYYAHLSAYEGVDRVVKAGEIIGYVGNTGNAASTPPHLHFEVHPSGGDAVNPYPLLVAAPIVMERKTSVTDLVTSMPSQNSAAKYTVIIVAGAAVGYLALHLWRKGAVRHARV